MLDRTNDDGTGNAGGALREALRRARAEAAAQTDVVVDLRNAEVARLELLREELVPVFAQTPREIDIFDLGLVSGERPRLFIDMVSFVEMGRDRRTYRFMRDGRHGRATIAESERSDKIIEEVTAYVARRLIERERLLADDDRLAGLGGQQIMPAPAMAPLASNEPPPELARNSSAEPAIAPRRGGWARFVRVLWAVTVGFVFGCLSVVAGLIAYANGLIPI